MSDESAKMALENLNGITLGGRYPSLFFSLRSRSLSLSLSLALSRLFQEIFITFFRYRSRTQLYSFAETRVSSFEIHFDSMTPGLIRAGKRRKGQQHDKKTVSCANISSFVRTIIPFIIFRRHSRYVPRTLLLRMKNKRS